MSKTAIDFLDEILEGDLVEMETYNLTRWLPKARLHPHRLCWSGVWWTEGDDFVIPNRDICSS